MRGLRRLVLLARTVRVLRLHPGDTLIVTYPDAYPLSATLTRQLLEDAVGHRNDVAVISLEHAAELTVVREPGP